MTGGIGNVSGGTFSSVHDVGEVSRSTAAIASSKYAVLTEVCFVVEGSVVVVGAAEVCL